MYGSVSMRAGALSVSLMGVELRSTPPEVELGVVAIESVQVNKCASGRGQDLRDKGTCLPWLVSPPVMLMLLTRRSSALASLVGAKRAERTSSRSIFALYATDGLASFGL